MNTATYSLKSKKKMKEGDSGHSNVGVYDRESYPNQS